MRGCVCGGACVGGVARVVERAVVVVVARVDVMVNGSGGGAGWRGSQPIPYWL